MFIGISEDTKRGFFKEIKEFAIPLAATVIPSLKPAYDIYEMRQREKTLREYARTIAPVEVKPIEIPWIPIIGITAGLIVALFLLSRK